MQNGFSKRIARIYGEFPRVIQVPCLFYIIRPNDLHQVGVRIVIFVQLLRGRFRMGYQASCTGGDHFRLVRGDRKPIGRKRGTDILGWMNSPYQVPHGCLLVVLYLRSVVAGTVRYCGMQRRTRTRGRGRR